MKHQSVPVTLPHSALPLADWADRFEIVRHGPTLTAIEAARLMLSDFPRWTRLLMQLRDALVRPLGLKTAASMERVMAGQTMVGPFPVIHQTPHEIVLGFDDRHLDFRIVVTADQEGSSRRKIGVTTLVRRKISLGRIYISVIAPFHRAIVTSSLKRLT